MLAHHSNLLIWRESDVDVIEVEALPSGQLDQTHLTELLSKYKNRPAVIGSFSAASNLTGDLSCLLPLTLVGTWENVNEITVLLHTHGALAFWDYAAAAPHCHLDMNPKLVGVSLSPSD